MVRCALTHGVDSVLRPASLRGGAVFHRHDRRPTASCERMSSGHRHETRRTRRLGQRACRALLEKTVAILVDMGSLEKINDAITGLTVDIPVIVDRPWGGSAPSPNRTRCSPTPRRGCAPQVADRTTPWRFAQVGIPDKIRHVQNSTAMIIDDATANDDYRCARRPSLSTTCDWALSSHYYRDERPTRAVKRIHQTQSRQEFC